MIRRRIETVATSNADNAAFRALADVAEITKQIDDVRIVGGHMASLLLTAFPVRGAVLRRTADADAAVSTSVAASGQLHRALVDAGYTDTSGNHYVNGDLEIDILVPSDGARFETASVGGRGFDAVPGLRLAFTVDPIVLDVGVLLTDGTPLGFVVRVPPVELALIFKAYAAQSRHAPKDITDLYNLLSIAFEYPADEIGGWKIGTAPVSGTRLDAARFLHALADSARQSLVVANAGVPADRLTALIRALVAMPVPGP
jgi:hypothetical protein